MVKKLLLIAVFFLTMVLCAQTEPESAQSYEEFKVIPKEKVYVHHNTSLLFSGEQLQYKVYFIDVKTKKLSTISKIGYVTLVSKNGEQVFNHKIILKNGAGYGDFFVPSSLPTGSYKLLAYSQWMRNQGIESFFQSNIQVINPYLAVSANHVEISKDSVLNVENEISTLSNVKKKEELLSDYLDVSLDKSITNKRHKLSLKINPKTLNVEKGEYSISIRRLSKIQLPNRVDINEFNKELIKTPYLNSSNTKLEWIPELRGDLVSGKVIDKESKNPIQDEKVALSLPGSNYLFQIATTDKKGNFFFNIDRRYDNSNGSLQIESLTDQNLDIIVDQNELKVSGLEFLDFIVSDELEGFIKERSLHNQIENAYIEEKSDSIAPAQPKFSFYRDLETTYLLDDYTRFNSIAETIIEVVNTVSLKTLESGKRVFQVRPPEGFTSGSGIPLVFIDGLYIQNHEDVLGYSAKKVESISFSTEKYLSGTKTFQGIIHIKTIKQDFIESFYSRDLKRIALFQPEPEKINHFQSYESSNSISDRIPDFRHQLLWIPSLNLTNEKEIHFYSSDVTGDFEIVFEGFAEDGQPVSMKKFFSVK